MAAAERRVAFLVGNQDYAHAPALDNPIRDVALIAETLGDLGFEVSRHENLPRDQIGRELVAFLRETEDADVTLFYFAGHGMQFEGQNYLVGTDARLETEFDVESEALNLDKVVAQLEARSRAALVFIDACRDNPLASNFYRRNFSETRAIATRGLAPVTSKFDGAMMVFSASPGQVAYDGDGEVSPFAAAVARHLPTANMEVLSVMKRVIRDVKAETADQQTPMVTNDLTAEIYLNLGDGREGDAIALQQEEALFEAATEIGTVEAWDDFLNRYKSGKLFAAAVKVREGLLNQQIASSLGYGDHAVTKYLDVPIRGELLDLELSFSFTTKCENDHYAKLVSPDLKPVTVMARGANRCSGTDTQFRSDNAELIKHFKGAEVEGRWSFFMKDADPNAYEAQLDGVWLKLKVRHGQEVLEYTSRAEGLPVPIPN